MHDSKNLIGEMYTEEKRLQSFKNWPFGETSKCSASKMAEAGFFHCPTEKEPDLVQCYVCFKELDGWEPNDDAWGEHLSHAKHCMFAKIGKPQRNLTIAEIYGIENERKQNKLKILTTQKIHEFRSKSEEVENDATVVLEELTTVTKAKRKAKRK